jgi:hypothetical protein
MLVWPLPANAGRFAVQPQVGMLVGSTSYGLSLDNIPGYDGMGVGSDLKYPLNFPVAGISVSVGFGRLTVEASVATNLSDPVGSMVDDDFITAPDFQQTFAHTESSAEARVVLAELCGRFTLKTTSVLTFELLLGYRHQMFVFDIFGAEGWVLDLEGVRRGLALADDFHGIHFVGHHALPFVGLGLNADWDAFRIDSSLRALGVISVTHDDHVARNKDGDGRAYGAGVSLSVATTWRVAGREESWALRVGPQLDFQYLNGGTGTLEQRYYGDDPSIAGDQAGESLPDTDFHVSSLQLRATLGAHFTF